MKFLDEPKYLLISSFVREKIPKLYAIDQKKNKLIQNNGNLFSIKNCYKRGSLKTPILLIVVIFMSNL